MTEWSFLTNHARALLCIAYDPDVRLRDIAAALDIAERSAFGIVKNLVDAGYVLKERDGRRNRYEVQTHLPLPDPISRADSVGAVLAVLLGTNPPDQGRQDGGKGRAKVRPTKNARQRVARRDGAVGKA